MNPDFKEAFGLLKPACDYVMILPSQESIKVFVERVDRQKKEVVQELQQYILFPFIAHIKSKEIDKYGELQWYMVDAICHVLEKVTVNNYEMAMQIETGLRQLVFDKSKPGMIADVSEELKLSVMRCLTMLMVHLDKRFLLKMYQSQVPLLAQAVFLAVHIAKLEKHRPLRLAALNCLMAHTSTHPKQTNAQFHIADEAREPLAVDMLCSILPGVMAALQDVANCKENPGHAVIVTALEATHRILCVAMHDKHLPKTEEVTTESLANLLKKAATKPKPPTKKPKQPIKRPLPKIPTKSVRKRSPEWYTMAGNKLLVVTQNLVVLRTHEHWRVRKELAVYCARLLTECNTTMRTSVPLALDVLISLSKDEYPEVADYCSTAVTRYFGNAVTRDSTMDLVRDNLLTTLESLPRILNNIDSGKKLSALNLLLGYVEILCDSSRPQRLTVALSSLPNMEAFCLALTQAAAIEPLHCLAEYANRDVNTPPPPTSPWLRFRHLSPPSAAALRALCAVVSRAEAGELVLDALLLELSQTRAEEAIVLLTWMGAASNCYSFVRRILDTYIEEELWYCPIEADDEQPRSDAGTCDVTVYDPHAWTTESVPDLYEGARSTRVTGISLLSPRPAPRPPSRSSLLAACLLTEGVGVLANRLQGGFRQYLMKTLCLLLERVGSKYEMLHLAGLAAIKEVSVACGHLCVPDLVRANADYLAARVARQLNKEWSCQSALQILAVVMEYSDAGMMPGLYGIVDDVLVQSCDKYHENNLEHYLQVFLTFVQCIAKFYAPEVLEKTDQKTEIDVLKDVEEYVKNEQVVDEDEGKSAEEMYREDMLKKEEEVLDYDDRVTEEKEPLPQHVAVTVTILKRCLNFVPAAKRDHSIRAMEVMTAGLPILAPYEDELLPLVHLSWAPLVTRFEQPEPAVLRRALRLLLTMAGLAKDFISSRTVKEVLPHIYSFLRASAADSRLKDKGSAYRGGAAFALQRAALAAAPTLAAHLRLDGARLHDAMACVQVYLSNKQPKPLQELAVEFFKSILDYDYGAAWCHLRKVCSNQDVLPAPSVGLNLEPVVGTPYTAENKEYDKNIKLIFEKEINKNKK